MLTMFFGSSPFKTRVMSSIGIRCLSISASIELKAVCGVANTCSMCSNGSVGSGGSFSYTSTPAPATLPDRRASMNGS